MSISVMKQALRALENNRRTHHYCEDTWYSCPKHEEGCANESEGDECNCGADEANAEINAAINKLRQAIEQEEKQEPVAWWDGKESVVFAHDTIYTPNWTDYWTKPLYADPTPCKTCEALSMSVMADHVYHEQVCPKKEWVGLTDEEIGGLTVFDGLTHIEVPILVDFVRAIEVKLKERNT